ncbi:putative dsRNA-binding protein [Deinococcus sp.]|uniref:putative dsRNA-binding protein n=1 Tax=Deinococcus sp. TaxID=47478 RepID=UPI0025C1C8BA|nr:putative dsRNA-binding protein [Deinococcus sp.]
MNAKGDLIARALTLGLGAPTFEAQTHGPPHDRRFRVTVQAGGQVLGEGGEGRSKRDAERVASESALRALGSEPSLTPSLPPSRPDMPETPDGEGSAAPGRWPIYGAVLAGALDAALEFAPEDASLDDVRRRAARLYRELLGELGHGPDDLDWPGDQP